MPNKYKPLTKEERAEVEKRYHDYVTKINDYLAANNKPTLDVEAGLQAVRAKMDDEATVARFRLKNEIEEKKDAQKAIVKELSKKYPIQDDTRNYLSRSIAFLMKTDGSPESIKYNDELYKSYAKNPETFTQIRSKNLMNFDPKELIEMGNDPVKNAEFYRDHMDICQEGNQYGDAFRHDSLGLGKEFKEASECYKGIVQKLSYGDTIGKPYSTLDCFAFPDVSPELAEEIRLNGRKVFKGPVPKGIDPVLDEKRGVFKTHPSISDIHKKLTDAGLELDPNEKNFFLKYKAFTIDPRTHQEVSASLLDFAEGKPGIQVRERTPEEIQIINHVSLKFQEKYHAVYKEKMDIKFGKAFNANEMKKSMKGGWIDRIFRRPSKAFKAFEKAVADYSDPNSKHYLDNNHLRDASTAYQNTVTNKNGLSAIEQKRLDYATKTNTVATDMFYENEQISGKINRELQQNMPFNPATGKREPAFEDDSLVEIFGKKHLESNDLNKSFAIEKEDEMENEQPGLQND